MNNLIQRLFLSVARVKMKLKTRFTQCASLSSYLLPSLLCCPCQPSVELKFKIMALGISLTTTGHFLLFVQQSARGEEGERACHSLEADMAAWQANCSLIEQLNTSRIRSRPGQPSGQTAKQLNKRLNQAQALSAGCR